MEVLFKQIEKFLPLNETIVEDIKSKIIVKHYQKREVVFTQKEICDNLYYVSKGLLRIFAKINDKEITTEYVEERQLSTIIESFHSGKPYIKNIVAEQNSEVFLINKKDFYTLTKKYQGFAEFVMNLNEIKWVELKKRELKLISLDSEQIYLNFVEENPTLYKKIKGKDLSTYLNMTQETASRIKKKNAISKK